MGVNDGLVRVRDLITKGERLVAEGPDKLSDKAFHDSVRQWQKLFNELIEDPDLLTQVGRGLKKVPRQVSERLWQIEFQLAEIASRFTLAKRTA